MPSNFISLAEAKALTTTYRKSKETILEAQFKGKNILPVCETFPRDAIDVLLAQPGCAGIRIYFAMDLQNLVKVVIVGVDDQDRDILPPTEGGGILRTTGEEEVIVDQGRRCPFDCPPESPLNG